MKLFDIMNGINYKIIQGKNVGIEALTIDSRAVEKGCLFFCIRGFSVDGHKYIENAAKQGAAAIIIDEEQAAYPFGLTVLKVENTRKTMSFASANFYNNPCDNMIMTGVTGTNGKTSVTFFLDAVFSEWGKNAGLIGTVETRIGGNKIEFDFATSTTPDAIDLQRLLAKMVESGVSHVAMEVTSHAIDLHKILGINFKVGVFTNLTQDHLDHHKTMENYGKTKAKLFKNCEIGVFNADDSHCDEMMFGATCQKLTYSIDKQSDLQAVDVVCTAEGVSFKLKNINQANLDKLYNFKCGIAGKFTVYNMLATIGAAVSLGVPVETIQAAFENMRGVPGRIEKVENDKGLNVIVDYSHTPDSLENIIRAVREFTKGKVITVFGCGGDRDRRKRPIMGEIAGKFSDYCIITSDNPRTENPDFIIGEIEPAVIATNCSYEKIVDRREGIFKAVALATTDDCVIIAGKGHENYQIFAMETVHFDDVEVAKEAIASLRD